LDFQNLQLDEGVPKKTLRRNRPSLQAIASPDKTKHLIHFFLFFMILLSVFVFIIIGFQFLFSNRRERQVPG